MARKQSDTFDVRYLDGEFFTGPAQRVLSRIRRAAYAQLIVVTGGVYTATVDTVRGA